MLSNRNEILYEKVMVATDLPVPKFGGEWEGEARVSVALCGKSCMHSFMSVVGATFSTFLILCVTNMWRLIVIVFHVYHFACKKL
jgi:hypothetical protein